MSTVAPPSQTSYPPPHRPLLLLVDDEPANLHVLASILRHDYRIKTATDGDTALMLATRASDPPDLVLLDVMMPGLSGHAVLTRLRQHPATAEVPIIFLTANTTEQSELDALDLGADDYLTKPIVAPLLTARVRNLVRRHHDEIRLRLLAAVFNYTDEGILIIDTKSRIIEVNPAYCRGMGYTREELLGATPAKVRSGYHDREFYQAMWGTIAETGQWQGEVWNRHRNGQLVPRWLTINALYNSHGDVSHYIGLFADIGALKEAEQRLEHLAYHDGLTGLPNRLLFRDRLDRAVALCQRERQQAAIMFLDLDRFKEINDSLGHDAGDVLLIEAAKRIAAKVRDSDTVARQGGDEFTLILLRITGRAGVARVANAIIAALQQPFVLMDQTVRIGASIGISLFPEDGQDYNELTKHADLAMYRAKQAGRGQFRFYSDDDDDEQVSPPPTTAATEG